MVRAGHTSSYPHEHSRRARVSVALATCYCVALGRLADFLSLSFLNCELQITEPVHRVVVRAGDVFVKWDIEVKSNWATKYRLTCANGLSLTLKKTLALLRKELHLSFCFSINPEKEIM